jgi:DNA-binding NarL/FixJ family response regulator
MFTVLIVEDDARFRQKLRNSLASRFPSVVFREAANGKEALQEIKSTRPAFIFMDIRLGDDNGLKLTEKIKHLYPEILISILTSYDFPEYREAAFKNGADFFLIKGAVTLKEIGELLEALLSRTDNQGNHNPSLVQPCPSHALQQNNYEK